MKLARQYFLELSPPQPQRTRFINRRQSYHGTTLGALSVSGHRYRRAKFEPLLLKNVSSVSPCFEFRGRGASESVSDYVERLAKELDDEFQRQGPENVCAFIAEPIVGAVSTLPRPPSFRHSKFTRFDISRSSPLGACRRCADTSKQCKRSATSMVLS